MLLKKLNYSRKDTRVPDSAASPPALWADLQQRLGHPFRDPALLAAALTHSSFANESREPAPVDNERLEFLGDAVLGLAVGLRLFRDFPAAREGELSRLRAELVSAPRLAVVARALGLGECLRLGRGEARSGGRDKENLLADALEALIGAVFLDAGFAAAGSVVEKLFAAAVPGAEPALRDCKTALQELLQARRQRPAYRLAESSGPDHRRSYRIEVLVEEQVLGTGEGPTKKRAEQEAARRALESLAGAEESQ